MIDDRHLAKHNMTKEEYIALYGKDSVTSKETKEKLHRCWELMINNKDYDKFTSTYEKQIQEFLDNNNIKYHTHNRSILKNNEIDILLDDFPIAIEFDGNLWHTENFGKKDKFYHLNKTNICNQNNIDLIHIFEDELKYKKDLVFKMLGDILNINNKKQICEDMTFYEIKEITENDFEFFLDENSLQIFNKADKYIILCYRNEIICGISFNERNEKCIIVNNFNKISDVFPYSLIISYISQKYDKFNEIIGYADRRWYNKERNIYNSLNFIFLDYVEPIYYLYNKNNNKSIRFNRNDIEKFKNNFEIDEDITDVDKILNKINFDKIWNCGFIKYKLDLK